MNSALRAKLEFSVTPVGVIAVCSIAAALILGFDVALKAAALALIVFVIKQAVEPLCTVWGATDDDDDQDPPVPQHGVPVGEPYAPSMVH